MRVNLSPSYTQCVIRYQTKLRLQDDLCTSVKKWTENKMGGPLWGTVNKKYRGPTWRHTGKTGNRSTQWRLPPQSLVPEEPPTSRKLQDGRQVPFITGQNHTQGIFSLRTSFWVHVLEIDLSLEFFVILVTSSLCALLPFGHSPRKYLSNSESIRPRVLETSMRFSDILLTKGTLYVFDSIII